MNLIIQPEGGIAPVLRAINRARQTIDVASGSDAALLPFNRYVTGLPPLVVGPPLRGVSNG